MKKWWTTIQAFTVTNFHIFILFSPWRIVEDMGAAFSMGAIGGSIFHAYKGYRNAPSVT